MEQQRIGSPGGTFTGTPGSTSAEPSTNLDTPTQNPTVAAAKEQGHRAINRLRQSAIAKVEDQRSLAVDQVQQLAHGLRVTSENLQREGAAPFGRLASTAADSVQRVGGYLQRTDVDGMARDFRQLARRHPSAVFGTALVAGVLLGRFLRSSSLPEREVGFQPDPSLFESRDAGLGGSNGIESEGPLSSHRSGEPPTGGWA
jgi:hypothetical protein